MALGQNKTQEPGLNLLGSLNLLYLKISMHFLRYGADKENLFNNQKLLHLMIMSFNLVTLTCDLRVIL